MSVIDGTEDPASQLLKDLTPDFHHADIMSLENFSLDDFDTIHQSDDGLNSFEHAHNNSLASSTGCDVSVASTTQTRRQSARLEAKQKMKKMHGDYDEGVSEDGQEIRSPGGGTRKRRSVKASDSTRQNRTKSQSKRSHGGGSSNYSSDSDDDAPDRIWCICRQPCGERFMICCDLCDEWYHGDCVGIAPEEGKRMEMNEIEFICDTCKLMSNYANESYQFQFQSFLDSDDFAIFDTTESPGGLLPLPPLSLLPNGLTTADIMTSLELHLREGSGEEEEQQQQDAEECDKELLTSLPDADDVDGDGTGNTTKTKVTPRQQPLPPSSRTTTASAVAVAATTTATTTLKSSISESLSTSVNSVDEAAFTVNTNENESSANKSSVNSSPIPLPTTSTSVTDNLSSSVQVTTKNSLSSSNTKKKKPRLNLTRETLNNNNNNNGGPPVKSTNLCLGPNCSRTINPQISLYCGNKCLKAYGMNVLRIVCGKHELDSHDKSNRENRVVDTRKPLVVLDRKSGTVLNGTRAPTSDTLIEFLSAHPTYQVVYNRQLNEKSQKSQSLNLSSKDSGQNEAHVNKTTSSTNDSSRSSSEGNNQQSLAPENIAQLRKKYQNLLFGLLEKRTLLSRHIFTVNRSKLKALAIELENVISSRNNLASPSKDSLQTDFSVYQAQLRLFLNCLEIVSQEKSEAVNTASVVSTSTTDPSIIVTLKDQFFDSLITGALKPSDLAHCQDVKTLESIVKRARIAEKAHVKISSTLSSSVNNNVNKSSSSSHPSSTQTSAPTSVENKTSTNNEPIDTTSEHGKHLYDMHCKRCTTHGQKKPSMKQSSLSSLLHPSKKSIPSASSDPGVSSLSMKTEPVDSSSGSTPLGGKASPVDPSPSGAIHLSKSSISPAVSTTTTTTTTPSQQDTTIPILTKLSMKCSDEQRDSSAAKKSNATRHLNIKRDSSVVQNSTKIKSNHPHPMHSSVEQYSPALSSSSVFTSHDDNNPISPKSLTGVLPAYSASTTTTTTPSLVSTGLLDLPLPPAMLNSTMNTSKPSRIPQSDKNNNNGMSVKPSSTTSDDVNHMNSCLWSGRLSLSTQYSGREHVYSLEINAYPFGCIHAKSSVHLTDKLKSWMEGLLSSSSSSSDKPNSLVVIRGVNLVSLPVYLGQTLLDANQPRELFAFHITPKSKQMSPIYADIFNHLKTINACGSLEPRFSGAHDCLLYPLSADTNLFNALLPSNLLAKFNMINCNDGVVLSENHLLIILTMTTTLTTTTPPPPRPPTPPAAASKSVCVTPSIKSDMSSPLPPSLTSPTVVSNYVEEEKMRIIDDTTTTDITTEKMSVVSSLPVEDTSLNNTSYILPRFIQPIVEENGVSSIKYEEQEVPTASATVATISINSSGDIDLRPLTTMGTPIGVNTSQQSYHQSIRPSSPIQPQQPDWYYPSLSTEDVDYREYIPQPHEHHPHHPQQERLPPHHQDDDMNPRPSMLSPIDPNINNNIVPLQQSVSNHDYSYYHEQRQHRRDQRGYNRSRSHEKAYYPTVGHKRLHSKERLDDYYNCYSLKPSGSKHLLPDPSGYKMMKNKKTKKQDQSRRHFYSSPVSTNYGNNNNNNNRERKPSLLPPISIDIPRSNRRDALLPTPPAQSSSTTSSFSSSARLKLFHDRDHDRDHDYDYHRSRKQSPRRRSSPSSSPPSYTSHSTTAPVVVVHHYNHDHRHHHHHPRRSRGGGDGGGGHSRHSHYQR